MMSARRSPRRLGAAIGYMTMRPPWCVENQLFGNTESGVSRPRSSKTCTRTPCSMSVRATASTSRSARASNASALISGRGSWKALSAAVSGLGVKWWGRTITTADGAWIW